MIKFCIYRKHTLFWDKLKGQVLHPIWNQGYYIPFKHWVIVDKLGLRD